jgi:hypothetical protein
VHRAISLPGVPAPNHQWEPQEARPSARTSRSGRWVSLQPHRGGAARGLGACMLRSRFCPPPALGSFDLVHRLTKTKGLVPRRVAMGPWPRSHAKPPPVDPGDRQCVRGSSSPQGSPRALGRQRQHPRAGLLRVERLGKEDPLESGRKVG